VPALGQPWESGVLKPGYAGTARLGDALSKVHSKALGCDLVIIEGYAFSQPNRAHQMGELGGVIRLGLRQAKIPVVIIPPSKLKKFATGVGTGKKERIFGECIRRLGYDGFSHDEADAIWLLQMAIHHYGLPGAVQLPKAQADASLSDVQWPKITVR
jgi:Holliday junction resolvasome RuvABC endonuclease subunit